IFVLVSAVREGVAAELLAPASVVPLDARLAKLGRRLEEHLALTPEAAAWAVETWALALGVLRQERAPSTAKSAGGTVGQTPVGTGRADSRFATVLAWTVGVAALWALVGGSAA